MVMCFVFFAVRTESLNIIQTSFGVKGLNCNCNLTDSRPYKITRV
jgi:hypothetical protein